MGPTNRFFSAIVDNMCSCIYQIKIGNNHFFCIPLLQQKEWWHPQYIMPRVINTMAYGHLNPNFGQSLR